MTTPEIQARPPLVGSGIIISSYIHVGHIVRSIELAAAVSILGRTDKLEWPSLDGIPVLRLPFDDTSANTKPGVAATPDHVRQLIEFSRAWGGRGHLLLHCRAGVSRSPAAAMVAAAAIGRRDLLPVIATARSFFCLNFHVLEIADRIFGGTILMDCARSSPAPDRNDPWEPVWVPISQDPADGLRAVP